MFGCCKCAASSISFLKRAALTSLASSGGSTLITTRRLSDASVATKSRLIPPPGELPFQAIGVAHRGLQAGGEEDVGQSGIQVGTGLTYRRNARGEGETPGD